MSSSHSMRRTRVARPRCCATRSPRRISYYDAHRKWFQWNRGVVPADADVHVLLMHARGMRDMLAFSAVPAISVGESIALAVPASVIHMYARAITGDSNLIPVSRESTQLCYRYPWLDPAQVKKLVFASAIRRDPAAARPDTGSPTRGTPAIRVSERLRRGDRDDPSDVDTAVDPARAAPRACGDEGTRHVAYEEPPDAD